MEEWHDLDKIYDEIIKLEEIEQLNTTPKVNENSLLSEVELIDKLAVLEKQLHEEVSRKKKYHRVKYQDKLKGHIAEINQLLFN